MVTIYGRLCETCYETIKKEKMRETLKAKG